MRFKVGNLLFFKYYRKIGILTIICLISSILFIQALTTSVPGTIAIQLDRDDTVISTSKTLQENVPGISIIDYDSFKFHLVSQRVLQPIVWIGHGNEEGISTNNELITWTAFSQEIERSQSQDIVLSCHSDEIIQQTTLTENDVIILMEK